MLGASGKDTSNNVLYTSPTVSVMNRFPEMPPVQELLSTKLLAPCESATLTVKLEPGTYT